VADPGRLLMFPRGMHGYLVALARGGSATEPGFGGGRPYIAPATANSDLSGKMAAIPVRNDGGIVAAE
jgi:hypothetical protein